MKVISIEEVGHEEVVYDLETECGTFMAGGKLTGLLVKNTDSCYVQFPINRNDFIEHGDKQDEEYMKANFKLAIECAKYCTSQFKPPVELEFEKFMYPLVLVAKKRYAYKEWTNPSKPSEEINYKGLQVIRRDTCQYVKEELNNTFEIIMKHKSKKSAKEEAIEYVKKSITNLFEGNVDHNKLVLSKQLKATYSVRSDKRSYEVNWLDPKVQHPHVRLAQQLRVIDPANHPTPPDRVPFLFIEKEGNNVLQCDKVVHPDFYNPKEHKIDMIYYFEHQYKKPIDMIFKYMVDTDSKGVPMTYDIYKDLYTTAINKKKGQKQITDFFKVKQKPIIVEEEEDENEEDDDDLFS